MCNPVSTLRPETLLSKGTHQGFEWEVTASPMPGYRCGYVRIPAGHPWHGQMPHADVHGSVNFAAPDTDCGKDGTDDAWWLGFDCAHAFDVVDPSLLRLPEQQAYLDIMTPLAKYGTIKTTEYVAGQCRELIEQASAAKRGNA